MKPITDAGYKLLHEGCIALSQVEANGMRIDVDYLNKAITKTDQKIKEMNARLKDDKVYKLWRKTYGAKTNLGSREQLGKILFGAMKYPCISYSKTTGKPKADAAALEAVDLKFVRRYLKCEKLKKANTTYLKGIRREMVDGYLHPFFHLNLVQTFRSSSSDINFQNIIIKNPMLAKLIRKAFIARLNHQIVEVDYSGAEICNAACYHKDPKMIRYIENPKLDLHRDQAMEIYMIPKDQVSWDARDTGKNLFVFPEFYGDYYIHCAPNMWNAVIARKIKTNDGVSLIKHLKRKGIIELGDCDPDKSPRKNTFEKHMLSLIHI